MSAADSVIVPCSGCGRRNRVPAAARGGPRCAQCHTPLPWLVEAGDGDFSEVAERARRPVLIDFWAEWCGPCRVVAPAVEELSRRMAGRLKVVKVNVDTAPATAGRFGVMSIPTLLLMRDGAEVDRRVGALGVDQLQQWLQAQLTRSASA